MSRGLHSFHFPDNSRDHYSGDDTYGPMRPREYEADKTKTPDNVWIDAQELTALRAQLASCEADYKQAINDNGVLKDMHYEAEQRALAAEGREERLRAALEKLLMVSLPTDVSGYAWVKEARAALAGEDGK